MILSTQMISRRNTLYEIWAHWRLCWGSRTFCNM